MPLHDYQAKRQFDQTPEPTGGQGSGPLRFVVQKHDATTLHYDFRLEMGGILKSWAVPKGPSLNPHDKHLAMMTEDHPYDYQYFEGVIPKGNYGAGPVQIWDEGTYEPLAWNEKTGETLQLSRDEQDKHARHGVHQEHLTFILHGHKLNGEFALIKMKHADEANAWLLVKAHKDTFVSEADITAQDRSAITHRTIEDIRINQPITKLNLDLSAAPISPLPEQPQPMLASLATKPFDHPDWLYEIKWDGYRILAELGNNTVTLHSRHNQDYTQAFQPAATDLSLLQVPALLDGEMTVVDEAGRPSFQDLQQYLRAPQGRLLYYAFDLLHLDGHDLTGLPLTQRKLLLQRLMGLLHGPQLKYSDHITETGQALLDSAKQQHLEGVIAKRADSPYQAGRRSQDWAKFKTKRRQEAIIIGYTKPRGGRQHFGALVLAIHDSKGKLTYAGHTGSGFSDATLAQLTDRFQPLVTSTCPIHPAPTTNEPAEWIKPKLVAEIEFTEWTADGSMRHPIFVGLRQDKTAEEVSREEPSVIQPAAATPEPAQALSNPRKPANHSAPTKPSAVSPRVNFTHRDKLYWPESGITKGQLLDYYEAIAPTILPYLVDRPESLNRFPNGITGPSFYQKDLEDHPTWANTTIIHSKSAAKDIHYLLCNDQATLLYMINLGCIDLNPWSSRLQHLDNPDWCVIDLDPEAINFSAVITTAKAVQAVLEDLHVPSFPKTSGATGIHIYIPMAAQYSYDQVKTFAELIAQLVHARVPDITSLERSPSKRQGKVYLDFLQNRHGQTLAAAYSVRPKPGATVSTPLHWDEVTPDLSPAQYHIGNILQRLSQVGDLWQPVLGPAANLNQVLQQLQNI